MTDNISDRRLKKVAARNGKAGKVRRKNAFGNDVLGISTREAVFEFQNFKCYMIIPHIVSFAWNSHLPGREDGFDFYVTGTFDREDNPDMELIACFNKIDEKKYSEMKLYILDGAHAAEARFVLNYSIRFYLINQLGFQIEGEYANYDPHQINRNRDP